MECVVQADDLERQNVDLISTVGATSAATTTSLRLSPGKVTELVQKAIAAHGRFREDEADRNMEEDPKAKAVRQILDELPSSQRSSSRRMST